jgi:NADP-dependent 3-hydroxy acid dehydrogenase YdfG
LIVNAREHPLKRERESSVSNTSELSGQAAVVTGASSGIGRAIAERLGAAGAFVVLAGRDTSALEQSARKVGDWGGCAGVFGADVRHDGAVQRLIDTAIDATGRLDVLVNNAGVTHFASITEADPQLWREMLDTNVLALLIGCQAAVRAMRATGSRGHIINISSVAALDPSSGVYGALKHAVNVISNTLRIELLEDPIQVTTIMPGIVATNAARHLDRTLLEGLVATSGMDVTIVPGEKLSDEVSNGPRQSSTRS